jgi:hypothetical protein
MNKQPILTAPDENKIEELLTKIQPVPSEQFHQKMKQATWWVGQEKEVEMSARNRRIKIAVALAIVLLIAVLIATPQGRAFAQSILQFFTRAESDMLSVPTEPVAWVDPSVAHPTKTPLPPAATFAEDCGDFRAPTCSVEQIREKVDFTVKEPRNIPDGIYFVGATGGPDSISLMYDAADNSYGLSVIEERWTGKPAEGTSQVGASADVQKVQIGNSPGEYFRGSFVMKSGESTATWDPNFIQETLSWVEGNTSYSLNYFFGSQTPLGKEGMVALAESMTTEPVVKLPMPATVTSEPSESIPESPFKLSIAEAEELAGFKLVLPPTLPDFLSLEGAMYEPETKVVTISYKLEVTEPDLEGLSMNGLSVSEQFVSNPEECAICDIAVGEDTTVWPDQSPLFVGDNANFELIQIGDVTAKYAEGVRLGDGTWEYDPSLRHLRWEANGIAFDLWDIGSLTKAQLITIAESLK